MNYCIFKLSFDTPLHCGVGDMAYSLDTAQMAPCADTLFSALCHTALKEGGTDAVEELCLLAECGELLLSDMMPYDKKALYIPRPRIKGVAGRKETKPENRKAMKKLSHIPLSSMSDLYASLRGKDEYNAQENRGNFGRMAIEVKNTIDTEGAATPYSVGVFCFEEGCGLWFIAGFSGGADLGRFEKLLTLLGLGGMGGRVSSGYGKFSIKESPIRLDSAVDPDMRTLASMLADSSAPLQISLTTSLPADDELKDALEGASYGLTRRGGFVASETFSSVPVRKRTQYFLSAGSVFTKRYRGALYVATEHGAHSVYRYGRPIFLGMERP